MRIQTLKNAFVCALAKRETLRRRIVHVRVADTQARIPLDPNKMYKCMPCVSTSSAIPEGWKFEPAFQEYWKRYRPGVAWTMLPLTEEDELTADEYTLTRFKIVRWHSMGTMFNDRHKLRWVLRQSSSHLLSELKAIDDDNEHIHRPTYHFREWFENAFYVPTDSLQLYSKTPWFVPKGTNDSIVSFAVRLREQTAEYRMYFGVSEGHPSGAVSRTAS